MTSHVLAAARRLRFVVPPVPPAGLVSAIRLAAEDEDDLTFGLLLGLTRAEVDAVWAERVSHGRTRAQFRAQLAEAARR